MYYKVELAVTSERNSGFFEKIADQAIIMGIYSLSIYRTILIIATILSQDFSKQESYTNIVFINVCHMTYALTIYQFGYVWGWTSPRGDTSPRSHAPGRCSFVCCVIFKSAPLHFTSSQVKSGRVETDCDGAGSYFERIFGLGLPAMICSWVLSKKRFKFLTPPPPPQTSQL